MQTLRRFGEVLATHDLVVSEDVSRREQIDASLWEPSDGLRPHGLGRLAQAVGER